MKISSMGIIYAIALCLASPLPLLGSAAEPNPFTNPGSNNLEQEGVQPLGNQGPWERSLRTALRTCPELACPETSYALNPLTARQVRQFDKATKQVLRKTARELALSFWPDTVLEGPYQTRMIIALDRIEILSRYGELTGYHITYSVKAYHMERCEYDSATDKETCEVGRISESAFIKADFSEAFPSPEKPARYSALNSH